jgi:hypothetical protein
MRMIASTCCWRTEAMTIKDVLALAIRLEGHEPALCAVSSDQTKEGDHV